MSVKTDTWAILAEGIIKKLKERGMDGAYYPDGGSARKAMRSPREAASLGEDP